MTYGNSYVPMDMWAKDHWTTLAYIDNVMVDNAGFQVGREADGDQPVKLVWMKGEESL